ncbi:hypothetical protein [Marinomonas rhodophyticola]|uniref:FAD dependent oxidoreductase n=1 Tax=Marinomonas rhodophyticola TaxID=2992803 RepID=A0ABT3KIR1_9GAMM|nr:hypothetical protein [Marinomonas sp. KJ51-3]MCW4630420.1 hypothetical protein [Marinomonas sp. KJ51-3]
MNDGSTRDIVQRLSLAVKEKYELTLILWNEINMLAKNRSTYTNMPFWLADTSLASKIHSNARFELPQKADAVIVGGGFTGISAAITLARAGHQSDITGRWSVRGRSQLSKWRLAWPKLQQVGRGWARASIWS